MDVTISIAPEIFPQVQQAASAKGQDIANFLSDLLKEVFTNPAARRAGRPRLLFLRRPHECRDHRPSAVERRPQGGVVLEPQVQPQPNEGRPEIRAGLDSTAGVHDHGGDPGALRGPRDRSSSSRMGGSREGARA